MLKVFNKIEKDLLVALKNTLDMREAEGQTGLSANRKLLPVHPGKAHVYIVTEISSSLGV